MKSKLQAAEINCSYCPICQKTLVEDENESVFYPGHIGAWDNDCLNKEKFSRCPDGHGVSIPLSWDPHDVFVVSKKEGEESTLI